jgi:hypothetical protein
MADDKSTNSATSVFCGPIRAPTHANRRKRRRHRYKPAPAFGDDGDAPILTARQYREARRRRRTAHRNGEISVDVNRGNSMSSAPEARSRRRGKLGRECSRQSHSSGASPSPPPSGHSDQFVQSSSSSDCGLDSSFFPSPLPPPPMPPPPSPPSSPEFKGLPREHDPVFHETVAQAGREASAHTFSRSHSHFSSDGDSPSYLPPPRRPTSPLSRDKSPSHSPPGRRLDGCPSRSRSPCLIRDRAHTRDSSPTGPIPRPQKQATSRVRSRSTSSRDMSPSHSPPGGRLRRRERARRRSLLSTQDLDQSGNISPSYPVPLSVGRSERRRHPRSSSSLAIQDGDSSPSYPVPRPQVPAISRVGNSSDRKSAIDGGSPTSRIHHPSTGLSDGNSPSYLPPPRRSTSPLSRDKSPSHSPPGRRLGGCHSRDSSPTGPIPRPQRQATSRVGNLSANSSDGNSPSYPPPPRRPRSRGTSSRDKSPSHSPPGGRLGRRERARRRSLLSTQDLDQSGNTSPSYPVPLTVGRSERRRQPRSSSSLAIQDGDSSPSYPVPRPQVPTISGVGNSSNRKSASDGGSPTSRIGHASTGLSDGNSPSYLPPPRRSTSPLSRDKSPPPPRRPRSRSTSSRDKSPSHSPPGGRLGRRERTRRSSLLSTQDLDQSGNTSPSYPVPLTVGRSERRRHPRSSGSLAIQDGDSSPSYPVPRPQVPTISGVGNSSNRKSASDGGSSSDSPPRLHKGYIIDNVSHHMSYPADLDHQLLVPFLLKKLGKTGSQFRGIAIDLLGAHDGRERVKSDPTLGLSIQTTGDR